MGDNKYVDNKPFVHTPLELKQVKTVYVTSSRRGQFKYLSARTRLDRLPSITRPHDSNQLYYFFMAQRERAIEAALRDLNEGKYTSTRAAAKAYGLGKSTLQGRVNGTQSPVVAHQHQQRMSPEQEKYLIQWILEMDTYGYPPSVSRTREMASRILQENGDQSPVGKRFISRLTKRHSRVKSIIGRKPEATRANAATPEQQRAWLQPFQATRDMLQLTPEDIFTSPTTPPSQVVPQEDSEPPSPIIRGLYEVENEIQQSETLSHQDRSFVQKTCKALREALVEVTTRVARQEAESARLRFQLAELSNPRKRRAIPIDPNQCFADLEDISSTINRPTVKRAKKRANTLENQSATTIDRSQPQPTFESMCNVIHF